MSENTLRDEYDKEMNESILNVLAKFDRENGTYLSRHAALIIDNASNLAQENDRLKAVCDGLESLADQLHDQINGLPAATRYVDSLFD